MPAVRVDRLAASHQLYVLLLACNHCVLPGINHCVLPGMSEWGFSCHKRFDAFRISSAVGMMKLYYFASNSGSSPAKKAGGSELVLV